MIKGIARAHRTSLESGNQPFRDLRSSAARAQSLRARLGERCLPSPCASMLLKEVRAVSERGIRGGVLSPARIVFPLMS